MTQQLTHIDAEGDARMVDVSEKAETKRTAIAEGFVAMQPETLAVIESGSAKKGDVLARLYTNKPEAIAESEAMFLRALCWSEEQPAPETLIFDIIR